MIRAQKASASNYDALIEIGDDAAVPSGVVGDTITFRATWKGTF